MCFRHHCVAVLLRHGLIEIKGSLIKQVVVGVSSVCSSCCCDSCCIDFDVFEVGIYLLLSRGSQ